MNDRTAGGRVRLPGIGSAAFVSDTDRVALENLQRLPLLPLVIRKFNEHAIDHLVYATNSAEGVRCGPNQYRSLHNLLREACTVMDVEEPELYVHYSPVNNAYTAGVKRPFIVLQSSVVDALTDEELIFVLGHELGHVKCGHVLYQMLAMFLLPLLDELGRVTLGVGRLAGMGLVMAFFEWLRQAEYSADRAGMLACQDREVGLKALMKLGGGSTRFNEEMDTGVFLDQARQHAEGQGMHAAAKMLLFFLYNRYLSHPLTVYRARGLDEWLGTGTYDRILAGDYSRAPSAPPPGPFNGSDTTSDEPLEVEEVEFEATVVCTRCRTVLAATMKFCGECGTRVSPYEEPV